MQTLGMLGGGTTIVVAAAAALLGGGESSPDAKLGERLYPDLATKSESVRVIEIARPEGTVVIQRDGESWRVPERKNYAADPQKVRQIFVEFSNLRTLEAKTRSPENYAALEVEDRDKQGAKSAKVSFKDADGKDVLAVLAGKNRYGRGGGGEDAVYVRRAGDTQAWMAKGRITVARDALQWLDREVTNIARERVREAVVVQEDGAKLVVRRDNVAEKDFAIVEMPADRKVKSNWEVNGVAGSFERLELDDVRPAAEITIPANAPTTTLETFDGLKLIAQFTKIDDTTWVKIGVSANPPEKLPEGGKDLKDADALRAEVEAINKKLGNWVYKMPNYAFEAMRRKIEDLLEQPPAEEKKSSG
jgi:hypothetical protein